MNIYKTNRKSILFSFIISALFFFVSCHTYYIPHKPPKEGVYEFGMIELGGVDQAVMIRGNDITNPVLFYLHGGPGFPFFPYLNQNEVMLELEEKYTMVYWEQRGTGKSFSRSIPDKSMGIDQFVEDAKQIIDHALSVTGKEKVFVWAHSWGSNFGAVLASQYPEYIHAYISTGQSVKPLKNEMLAYEHVYQKAKATNNRKALRELQTISEDPELYSLEDALLLRKWVKRYGGIIKESDKTQYYIDISDLMAVISTHKYTLRDRVHLLTNPYYSINMLWEDLKDFNLFEEVPVIDVPVFFLLGRHDIIVSSEIAEQYFNKLNAPGGKKIIWFEDSAHRPFYEEQEKFLEVMKKTIPKKVLY